MAHAIALAMALIAAAPAMAQEAKTADEALAMTPEQLGAWLLGSVAKDFPEARAEMWDTGVHVEFAGPAHASGYPGLCVVQRTAVTLLPGDADESANPLLYPNPERADPLYRVIRPFGGQAMLDAGSRKALETACRASPPVLTPGYVGYFTVNRGDVSLLEDVEAGRIVSALVDAQAAVAGGGKAMIASCDDISSAPKPGFCANASARVAALDLRDLWGVGIDPCRQDETRLCINAAFTDEFVRPGIVHRIWLNVPVTGSDPAEPGAKWQPGPADLTRSTLDG